MPASGPAPTSNCPLRSDSSEILPDFCPLLDSCPPSTGNHAGAGDSCSCLATLRCFLVAEAIGGGGPDSTPSGLVFIPASVCLSCRRGWCWICPHECSLVAEPKKGGP